jgi:hypothetical protein
VTVAFAIVKEGRAIGFVCFRPIELAGFSLWCHTIPLNIAEMGTGRSEITSFEF